MALLLWRRWGAQPFDLVVPEWPVTFTGVVLAETARPAARDGQTRHREGQGIRVIFGSDALSALSDQPDGADTWQEGQMVSTCGTTGIRRGTA
jgi:hypothetical protein